MYGYLGIVSSICYGTDFIKKKKFNIICKQ